MNPNAIILTPDQLVELKEGLIRELEPMIRAQIREENSGVEVVAPIPNLWLPIKNSALAKLNHLDQYKKNQVTNGLSAIVRNTFGVRTVGGLTEVQVQIASKMVDVIVDLMIEYTPKMDKPSSNET